MKKTNQLFLLFILLASMICYSQEICNNGIDDDGDGYVDCYDDECFGDPSCSDSYFGKPIATCQYIPPVSNFILKETWRTDNTLYPMDNRQTPIVGDIDNDGIPEVIAKDDQSANRLYVFNGADGTHELTITAPSSDRFLDAIAIADVDLDGFGEIIFVAQNPDRTLYCYEHDGTLKWNAIDLVGYSADADRWTPSIADFDADGVPEIYVGNMIFNSLTGVKIAEGGSTNSKGSSSSSANEPFPVAVDVLPDAFCANCTGLELVCGNQVYSVNIATGTMTVEVTAVGGADGLTSLADMDLDGDLDAVVCYQTGGRGNIFIWDIQTSTSLSIASFQIDNATASISNTTAGGHPLIADLNGDDTLEIGIAGRDVYVAIDFDAGTGVLSELWSNVTNDNSERTGSVAFDFEDDDANEIVYKDEDYLYIYNGATGTNKASIACGSGTRYDLPIVVDVNADGQTNIVCACSDNPGTGSAGTGFIIAFEAQNIPWQSSRQVYNQHSYFNVNINDNLTVPKQQQNHSLGYPQAAPIQYPLNQFLMQSSPLSINGNSYYAATDATITIDSIDPTNCGSTPNTLQACFTITNNSNDKIFPAGTSISLYNGDPFVAGATLITTTNTTGSIATGGGTESKCIDIPDQGGLFTFYVIANDNGLGTLPITQPSTSIPECDFNNNTANFVIDCVTLDIADLNYNTLLLYPNPVHSQITVNGLIENTNISIVSILGKTVLETTITKTENTIDVSKLSDGLYLIKLKGAILKFVKE
ncbi:MAG: hypothetical protein COA88_03245 [Kordia sp.]|nr:MAG: hypothetical protein COA88_03245 [Kordia sp.]